MAFVHYTVKKIVHGLGAIKEAANEVKNLKGSKAFIVTDPGLAKDRRPEAPRRSPDRRRRRMEAVR